MQRVLLHGGITALISEYLLLDALGGSMYYACEVLFRGYSHWTMFLLGGLIMVFCGWQGKCRHWQDSLFRQASRCVLFTACGEFVTGILVNLVFNWHVWDYHRMPFQLWGQVCLPYTLLFFLLCIIAVFLCHRIDTCLYSGQKH